MFEVIDTLSKGRFLISKEKINLRDFLNFSVLVLIGLYIFINPFPHLTAIKETSFYLSFLILLILLFRRKTDFSFTTPLTIPFILFIGWTFTGLFFALDKENSIHDFYSHLLRYIVLYFIIITVFNSRKRFTTLSRIIIASSTTYSIWGIIYFYLIMGYSWATRYSYGGAKGFLGYEVSGNSLCVLVIFSILLSLNLFMNSSPRGRIILFLCTIPQLTLIFLIQSKGGFIALFLSVMMILWKNRKLQLAALILLVVITAMSPIKKRFSVDQFIKNYRIRMMFTTLEIVKDYPIIGIGFGNLTYGEKIDLEMYNNRVPEKFRQKSDLIIGSPHNMLLNILVRLGVVGLALFLFIIAIFVRMCWQCIRYGKDDVVKNWGLCMLSAFLAFFVIGMADQMFHHFTEVVLYTILSMGTIIWRINKEPSV